MPRELSAYLYVSVRNRCVDRMRRKPELPLDDVDLDLIVAPPGDDDRIERLLRGYRLPDVSRDLDHRVSREGAAIMARARTRATAVEVGRTLLHRLGFGYLAWLVDLVTTANAEYRVVFI